MVKGWFIDYVACQVYSVDLPNFTGYFADKSEARAYQRLYEIICLVVNNPDSYTTNPEYLETCQKNKDVILAKYQELTGLNLDRVIQEAENALPRYTGWRINYDVYELEYLVDTKERVWDREEDGLKALYGEILLSDLKDRYERVKFVKKRYSELTGKEISIGD